ncbi:MAG: amidohydrolase [Gemmatimonadota bacterium]|nr:amidohydrolase [Gemmatimonadota bacterium]
MIRPSLRSARSISGAVLALALLAGPVSGQETPTLDDRVERVLPEIVEARHTIHANPELSNRETETAALVASHLRDLGLEVEEKVAKTGVVGILRGGRPGPVVAVRADMDALPVTERTDLPFRSTRRTTYQGREVGVAHACGHDVHTAVGLGVASVLAPMRDSLPGTVKFLFQPAEEGPPPGEAGGASLMLEEGALEDPRPDAIFALHSTPELNVGTVGWISGPTYASSDHFVVTIEGKQSHGAYPHLAVDPIVTAAQAILALQTIRSRTLEPTEPGVVSVGIVEGGERNNIIPESVRLEGTIRTYDDSVRSAIKERIDAILDGVTSAAGADYALEYHPYAPPTVNDADLAAFARDVLVDALGPDAVVNVDPVMGAEDFAWFAREVPGFYFRLGTTAPGIGSGALHTPDFRADDGAIPVGIRAMSSLVIATLRRGGAGAGGGGEAARP